MRLSFCVPALAVLAVALAAPGAFAFTTVTEDGYPSTTISTRLADPEDIMSEIDSQRWGRNVTVSHFGNTTIGIMGPNGGMAGVSPFDRDPASSTVLSKQQGW